MMMDSALSVLEHPLIESWAFVFEIFEGDGAEHIYCPARSLVVISGLHLFVCEKFTILIVGQVIRHGFVPHSQLVGSSGQFPEAERKYIGAEVK
jgi:hypothetical protein